MYKLNEWGKLSVVAVTPDGLLLSQIVTTESGIIEERVMTYPMSRDASLEEATELLKSYPFARIVKLKSASEFTGSMQVDEGVFVGSKLSLSGVLSDEDTTLPYVVGELDVPVEDFDPVDFLTQRDYVKIHQ